MTQVLLNKFDNRNYKPANKFKIMLWYVVNMFIFATMIPIPSSVKAKILRVFGANIGRFVVFKPRINIKYPWFLTIGDNCWIGEGVWIDNLTQVTVGRNVCLSQGSYLLTGSHNYKKKAFDLMVREIILEDGVWIGAKAIVCPGITCKTHSVLSVGSIATKNLEEFGIYQGNPAVFKRQRSVI
jgi:putative colanic acid biosynthesis acetyltransferase WcaF